MKTVFDEIGVDDFNRAAGGIARLRQGLYLIIHPARRCDKETQPVSLASILDALSRIDKKHPVVGLDSHVERGKFFVAGLNGNPRNLPIPRTAALGV